VNDEIRFIDLFSGIGGFRLGLERTNKKKGSSLEGAIRNSLRYRGNSTDTLLKGNGKNGRKYTDNSGTEQLSTQSGKWNENEEAIFNKDSSQLTGESGSHTGKLCSFRCVWSCDNNKYANQIYIKRFGKTNHYSGDIRGIDSTRIPDFDLLCAGFPCQAFSAAGKRKGFEDTRGTLFFEICRIAESKRPALLLLENVKGLLSHDRGRTFTVILQSLDELGYWVEWQVLNSKHFGVPQNRERVFIIGHLRGTSGQEVFPVIENGEVLTRTNDKEAAVGVTLANISRYFENGITRTPVQSEGLSWALNAAGDQGVAIVADRTRTLAGKGRSLESPKSLSGALSSVMKDNLVLRLADNWFSQYAVYNKEGVSPTLRGAQHDSAPRIFDENINGNIYEKTDCPTLRSPRTIWNKKLWDGIRIRRLTPVECERLQGFPDGWTELGLEEIDTSDFHPDFTEKEVSDTQRYKCLGNAVTVNVVEFLGHKIQSSLSKANYNESIS